METIKASKNGNILNFSLVFSAARVSFCTNKTKRWHFWAENVRCWRMAETNPRNKQNWHYNVIEFSLDLLATPTRGFRFSEKKQLTTEKRTRMNELKKFQCLLFFLRHQGEFFLIEFHTFGFECKLRVSKQLSCVWAFKAINYECWYECVRRERSKF